MTIGLDDLIVTDAYVALTAGGPPEAQIPPTTPFFIIVKAQAGQGALSRGIAFRLHVLVQDITNGYASLALTPPPVVSGNLNTSAWKNSDQTFTFKATSGPQDSIYQLQTILSAGATQTAAQRFVSETLVIVAD